MCFKNYVRKDKRIFTLQTETKRERRLNTSTPVYDIYNSFVPSLPRLSVSSSCQPLVQHTADP